MEADSHDEQQKRLDGFLQSLPPCSDEEKREMLLNYFSAIIEPMDRATLLALRAHLRTLHPGTTEEAIITEVIDGQLALREIRQLP